MKYRKSENYIVAHCYGVIHTMRLLKSLRSEDLHDTVKGCVLISIGVNCPVSSFGGSLTKIPAFFLGMSKLIFHCVASAEYLHGASLLTVQSVQCTVMCIIKIDRVLCMLSNGQGFILQTIVGTCPVVHVIIDY